MKLTRSVAAFMLAAVLTAGTLAGCGRAADQAPESGAAQQNIGETSDAGTQTENEQGGLPNGEELSAQSVTRQAAENLGKISAVSLTQDVEVDAAIGVSFLSSDLSLISHTDVDYVKDPGITHQKSSSYFCFWGQEEETTDESYYVRKGSSHILYNKAGDEPWTFKDGGDMGYGAEDLMNTAVFEQISSGEIDAQLADYTVQVNGRDAYLLTFRLEGEEIETALAEIIKEFGDFDEEVGPLDFAGISIPATVCVYRDTMLPAKVEIDGREVGQILLESMVREQLGDSGSGMDISQIVTINDMRVVTTINEYDHIATIEVPEEVVRTAVQAQQD